MLGTPRDGTASRQQTGCLIQRSGCSVQYTGSATQEQEPLSEMGPQWWKGPRIYNTASTTSACIASSETTIKCSQMDQSAARATSSLFRGSGNENCLHWLAKKEEKACTGVRLQLFFRPSTQELNSFNFSSWRARW